MLTRRPTRVRGFDSRPFPNDEMAERLGSGLQTRPVRFDSGSRLQNDALEVLSEARRLARSEARGQFPASAQNSRTCGRVAEAPRFQRGDAGSIPVTCSAGRVDLVSQPGLISQATPVQHGPCY